MGTWPKEPTRRPPEGLALGTLLVVPAGGARDALARRSAAREVKGAVFVGEEPAQLAGGLLVPPRYLPPPEPTDPPRARGPRAQALWDQQHDLHELAGLVLLEETCRMVDRLDALHALIAGDVDTWAQIVEDRNLSWANDDNRTVVYELHIDAAAGEARLLANSLRQMLAALAAMPKRATDLPDDQPATGDDSEDEVTRMRNRRETSSSWGTRGAGLDVHA